VESFEPRRPTVDRHPKRRSPAAQFSMLGHRRARPAEDGTRPNGTRLLPRFPINRQGYDCDSVDAHVADLEAELADVKRQLAGARAQASARDEVAVEIDRIGEQTSSILVAAHDEAQHTMRLAQTHANTVIADAASYAAALSEEAKLQVQALEAEMMSLSQARQRLIDDVRKTAAALSALADDGSRPLLGASSE
jgi:hypothetical protein